MSDNELDIGEGPVPTKNRLERDPERWFVRPMTKERKRDFDFKPNQAFFRIADPVMEAKRTLVGYDRLYGLWQAAKNVTDVPGAAAEIGTFQGGSAYFLASALASLTGNEVPMYVVDTFEGHPEQAITDKDPFQAPGQFATTSYDDVRSYLAAFSRLQVHKGDAVALLPQLPETAYRLVHIDTDLYQPTLVCLNYFGARLSARGIMVVDDYGQKKCPGVSQAVSEYLERTQGFSGFDVRTEQVLLVKH